MPGTVYSLQGPVHDEGKTRWLIIAELTAQYTLKLPPDIAARFLSNFGHFGPPICGQNGPAFSMTARAKFPTTTVHFFVTIRVTVEVL